MFISIILISDTFEEGQKKISKIVKNKQVYAYSTDSETHAKEQSANCTKYFQAKAKQKDDISKKFLYENSQEKESYSNTDRNSSTTCMY